MQSGTHRDQRCYTPSTTSQKCFSNTFPVFQCFLQLVITRVLQWTGKRSHPLPSSRFSVLKLRTTVLQPNSHLPEFCISSFLYQIIFTLWFLVFHHLQSKPSQNLLLVNHRYFNCKPSDLWPWLASLRFR